LSSSYPIALSLTIYLPPFLFLLLLFFPLLLCLSSLQQFLRLLRLGYETPYKYSGSNGFKLEKGNTI